MRLHTRRLFPAILAAVLAAPALAAEPAPPANAPPKLDLPPIAERPTGQRLPGKVIWFDLLALDAARVRPFYEGVFGWTFEDKGAGYLVARDGGVPVAGILQMPTPAAGAPAPQSRWMPLISVVDVAKAAYAAQKSGGRVLEGPGTLGRRGPYAAVADPRGAQFVLVTAAGGDPVDADAPPPGWIWAELWTDDLKGSAAFYRAVVGYDVWQVGSGKQATWIYASGGRPRARAARMPFEKVPAQWLPYVVVKDLKGTLARVPTLGGTVLRKPGAKGAQFAVVSDPGGATLILEQRPEAPVESTAATAGETGAALAGATGAVAAATGTGAAAATGPGATAATGAPTPPPEASSDPFGIDAAQRRSQEEAAAQAAQPIPIDPQGGVVAVPGDVGVVVAAPSPFVNVWIAPPAWGPYWGPGWGMPPGWIGAPWWGAPPYWGPGYRPPPYYPGRPGYYPGYRPPPGMGTPGGRPPGPAYRPPAPPPAARPAPAPAPRSAPAPAPRR